MIRSMTGFARAERTAAGVAICWELRSVNHRFLDISLRLPESWRRYETEFRAAIAAPVSRGKLDATLRVETAANAPQSLSLDETLLARLLETVAGLAKHRQVGASIDPLELLRWPGLLHETGPALEALHEPAVQVLGEALGELDAARQREGERLAELLRQRLTGLGELVGAVRARLPGVQAALRVRLNERIAQLEASVDAERIEQEVVLLVQKMDVAEELDRLAGHIGEVAAVLERPEPAGRRLDFLMQELNREANTLASKVQDQETTRLAVDMKVLIEQLREQAQNVE